MALKKQVSAVREKLTIDTNYDIIFNQLKSLLVDQFEWFNLPEDVDQAILENSLFHHGTVLFTFYDDVFYTLPALPQGWVDIYGFPYIFKPSTMGSTKVASTLMANNFKENMECVIIRNVPKTHKQSILQITEYYAAQLAHIKTIMNVNSALLAKPYIIVGNENEIRDGLSEMEDIFNYEPVVVRLKPKKKSPDDKAESKAVDVFQTTTTANINELQQLYRSVYSEFLTMFGFNHIEYEKKERLITDEAKSNDQLLMSGLSSLMLEQRQRACEEILTLYGRDVWVEFKHKQEEVINNEDINADPELDNDEPEDTTI